jgi:spore maturation protein A
MMTVIVALMLGVSLLFGIATGNLAGLSAAVTEGAATAVSLTLSLAGVLCLWSGVLEVLRRCGGMEKLAHLLRPVLSRLYPEEANNGEVMGDIAANVSANLLGLGSAATPAGIRAAKGMDHGKGIATDAMCTLIVCNTASIQLIPATIASIISVTVGICAAKLFARVWRRAERWR